MATSAEGEWQRIGLKKESQWRNELPSDQKGKTEKGRNPLI